MKNKDIVEDSLLQVWSHALPKIPQGRWNKTLIVLGTLCWAFISLCHEDNLIKYQKIQSYFDLYAQIVGSILGLTIAGFTIFVTSYSPNFALKMWGYLDEETGFSMYKSHLLNFMSILISCLMNLLWVLSVALVMRMIEPNQFSHLKETNILLVGEIAFFAWTGFLFSSLFVQLKAMFYNFYNLALVQMKAFELDEKSKIEHEEN